MLKKLKEKLAALQAKQQEAFDKMIEASTDESIKAYEMATKAAKLVEDQINELEKKELEDKGGVPGGGKLDEGSKPLTEEQQFFKKLVEAVSVGTSLTALVPTTIQTAIQAKKDSISGLRRFCTVHPTSGNYTLTVEGNGVTVDYVGEGEEVGETDDKPNPVTLVAYKLGALTKITREAITDVAVNLQEYLVNQIAKAMAKKEDHEILFGTGSTGSHITGVMTNLAAVEAAKVETAGATLAFNDILNLINALGDYGNSSILVMNLSTANLIKQMKDGNKYIFDPNQPLTVINGCQVVISKDVDTVAAGKNVIVAGDFSYYHIADRQGLEIQTLLEKYATSGQVGILATERIDGKPSLNDAFRYLQVKSA